MNVAIIVIIALAATAVGYLLWKKTTDTKPDPVPQAQPVAPAGLSGPVVQVPPARPQNTGIMSIGGIPAGIGNGGPAPIDDGQSGGGQRESDFSSATSDNLWNTGTAWRVGFSEPGSKILTYKVNADRGNKVVLVIDNPNSDVSVTIDGTAVANGDAVPTQFKTYEIVATAADTPHVRDHGARANIQFSVGA